MSRMYSQIAAPVRSPAGDLHRGADISHSHTVEMYSVVWRQMIRCAVHHVQLIHETARGILGSLSQRCFNYSVRMGGL
jgi:adenylate cyclase